MAWSAPATAVTGTIAPAAFWNTNGRDNLLHLYGPVSLFTPTVTQSGSVTLTTAIGRYRHVGKHCTLHCSFDFGGTGTGNNAIVVGNVPAAIAPRTSGTPASSTADVEGHGSGFYFDTGSAMYLLTPFFATSSTVSFLAADVITGAFLGVNGGQSGAGGSLAIAAGDSLNFSITYETAAASA